MRSMSETTQPSIPPSPAAPPPAAPPPAAPLPAARPPEHERLYQVAAWVAIIAGVTLIAVVVLRFVWAFYC
jgi:hypothetical protein